MRRKKHKQTRRATNYYRINYGFHEPYKVLLDGNFIHAMKAMNLSDLDVHLPKLLGATCKLYTTKCVTRELRSLGREFSAAAAAARSFTLHKCDHEQCGGGGAGSGGEKGEGKKRRGGQKGEAEEEEGQVEDGEQEAGKEGTTEEAVGDGPISAADCILSVIGRSNEQHWFVATQDAALRQKLGEIPGCPLVFATVNGVHLDTPSEVTRQKAKEAEAATRALGVHERAAEPLLREEHLAVLRREERERQRRRVLQALGGTGGGGVPPATTSARFRRNKAKGPNPLANKKKAKKPVVLQQQKRKAQDAAVMAVDEGAIGNGQQEQRQQLPQPAKRRRKRSKQLGSGATEGAGQGESR